MNAVKCSPRLAHHHIWQALPRSWRRKVLIGLTTALAPRPRLRTPVDPIIVVGFLTAASGMGASARLCYEAIQTSGMLVMGVDLTRQFRQDSSTVDFSFVDGRAHRGPATVILHVNGPFVPLAMLCLGRAFVRHKFVVAYWAWELPEAPNEWRAGLGLVHSILVPSTFTRNAVATLHPKQPVDVLFHPVARNDLARPRSSPNEQPFTVLVVFNVASGFERKNPLASLAAFRSAFGCDPATRLIIKLLNGASHPESVATLRHAADGYANIEINDRNLRNAAMVDLYSRSDVVLSLHRSEGFGLVIAEAMLAGRPVVATNWSGNTDFFTSATGVPVGYRLIPARDPQGEYEQPTMSWADPDPQEAAAALRRLRDDPELRQQLGRAAYEHAAALFSPSDYAARLKSLLGMS